MCALGPKFRMLTITLVAIMVMALLAPMASFASSKGSRNTAIGLAGVAAYLLVRGKTVPGIAAAAGAAYAYKRSRDQREQERYRDRYGYYNGRYYDRGRYEQGRYYEPSYGARYGSGPEYRHDNGLHRGWYKNGKAYGARR